MSHFLHRAGLLFRPDPGAVTDHGRPRGRFRHDICLKARQHARQVAVWTLLRELDVDGQGWIWRRSAIEAVREYLPGGKGPLSRQSIRRILRAGDNIFWTLTRDAIYYWAPKRICRALGIERVRTGERMDIDELSGPIGGVRARLAIRGIARIRKERPTSNAAASCGPTGSPPGTSAPTMAP